MVHLAESYQVKPRTFILDISNIRLNAELTGKVFGIPSQGDPFPALDDSNPCHVAIKNRFHRRTTTELWDLVYSCPMATESDRMEFRRYFILVVMKMFLCPTTQQVPPPSGDEGSAASPAPPVPPGRTRKLRPLVPTSRTRQLRPPQQISSEINLQFQVTLGTLVPLLENLAVIPSPWQTT
ncbi:hypothetical protein AHAS_Ahas19G0292500 [Arachis hypogaea]